MPMTGRAAEWRMEDGGCIVQLPHDDTHQDTPETQWRNINGRAATLNGQRHKAGGKRWEEGGRSSRQDLEQAPRPSMQLGANVNRRRSYSA